MEAINHSGFESHTDMSDGEVALHNWLRQSSKADKDFYLESRHILDPSGHHYNVRCQPLKVGIDFQTNSPVYKVFRF